MKPAPPVTRFFVFLFHVFHFELDSYSILFTVIFGRSLLDGQWNDGFVNQVWLEISDVDLAAVAFALNSRNTPTVANTTVSMRRLMVIGASLMPNGV